MLGGVGPLGVLRSVGGGAGRGTSHPLPHRVTGGGRPLQGEETVDSSRRRRRRRRIQGMVDCRYYDCYMLRSVYSKPPGVVMR